MKTKFTLVLSILSGAAWVGAQPPECTNPEADTLFNNVAGVSGNYKSLLWDVKALHDVIIDTMYIEFNSDRESTISIWTKEGIFKGYEKNENAWTQVVSDLVLKTGTIPETLFIPFKIEKGATQSFYVFSTGPELINYTQGGIEGSITAENDDLIMYYGIQKYGGWNADPHHSPRSLRTKLNYRRCDGATKSPSPGPKTESPTPKKTPSPTTMAPTTSAPTTTVPTTLAPTTTAPTTMAPTKVKDPCVNLTKRKCKNKCVFSKRQRQCLPKSTSFEHDCGQYEGKTPCLENKVCKFPHGKCIHRCDGKNVRRCRKHKFCILDKVVNPCFGCHLVTACGPRR